jgi:lipopolysaccharide/colanic/teichoic acid biosynthesis glycosyltransferase
VSGKHSNNGPHLAGAGLTIEALPSRPALDEKSFHRTIALERKRSERSRNPFLLILLQMGHHADFNETQKTLDKILTILCRSTRETDTVGWYESNQVVGVIFTEIGLEASSSTSEVLIGRVEELLRGSLESERCDRVSFSVHIFPEGSGDDDRTQTGNQVLYPDIATRHSAQRPLRAVKRCMDIVGSLTALVFLSPVFLIIAIAIKASSKGPVFYRQCRSGQFGVPFPLLKFRSMYDNSTSNPHKEYVRRLIAGVADKNPTNGNGRGVYKLTRDKRITGVGALLRRTSLDELPQLINVLKGEMSLVGPRPPVDYEVEKYQLWHRQRMMEARPGITGLWQVSGRNRIKFDEMVRLDLRYARFWSLWLDLKILLRTPRAVIEGAH